MLTYAPTRASSHSSIPSHRSTDSVPLHLASVCFTQMRMWDPRDRGAGGLCRVAARFRDPRLRALFTFQDLYVGLSPYTAPAVFSLLLAMEVTQGVWYPVGGFGQVPLSSKPYPVPYTPFSSLYAFLLFF